jgi:signal transduction histidine kinase
MKVKVDVPGGLPSVAMDLAPLQAVLGHVLENAVEACTGTGVVHVGARTVELTEADAQGYLGRPGPGRHIEVTVRDTGCGIEPGVRAKLFAEPFYTTKVRHRGLGLAIAYRILHAHQGGVRIDAATPPDSGTVVRVCIPLAPARPAVVTAPAGGPPNSED